MSRSYTNRFISSSPREKQQATQWKHPFQEIISDQRELILKMLIPSITAHQDELFPFAHEFFFQTNETFDQTIASCFISKRTKDLSDLELKGKSAYILLNYELVYINHYGEKINIEINLKQLEEIIALFPDKLDVLETASKDSLNRLSLLTGHYPRFLVDEIGDLVLKFRADELFKKVQDLLQDLLLPIQQSPNWSNIWTQKNRQADPYLQELIAGAFLSKILDFLIIRLKEKGEWNEQSSQQIDAIKTVCRFPSKIFFSVECEKRLELEIKKQMSKIIVAEIPEDDKPASLQKTIADNPFFRMLDPQNAHEIYLTTLKNTQRIFSNAISEELLSPLHEDINLSDSLLIQQPERLNFFKLVHSAFEEFKGESEDSKDDQSLYSKHSPIEKPRAYDSTSPIKIPLRSTQQIRREEDPILLIPSKVRRPSFEKKTNCHRPKLELPTVSKVNTPPNIHGSGQAKGTLFNQDKPNSSKSNEEEYTFGFLLTK